MLQFQSGEPFATGAMEYQFRPIPPDRVNDRILLNIKLNRIPALAAVDTGAPYVIIAPHIASRIGFDPAYSLEKTKVNIRGIDFHGFLDKVNVELPASLEMGYGCSFEVTAFYLALEEKDKWGNLPNFLGIKHCLEKICFALDPSTETFYFSDPAERM
jgi:hypothetical protein